MSPINRKRLQRKRTKWINTIFARHYMGRFRFGLARIASILAASSASTSAIRSTKAFAPADKANKAFAIANEVIGAHQSIRIEALKFNHHTQVN